MSNLGDELLDLPYLKIDYQEVHEETVLNGGINAVTELKFSSDYIFNSTSTWETIDIFFWILFWLMLVVLVIFTYMLCTEKEEGST